jgi:DNA invertase Pin-like site-specific DNA recombinase
MKDDHTKNRMKCCLYLRVSSEEQLSNFSIATQEDICRGEASRRGLTVDRVFVEEGKSAKNITGRPQLIELLEYCRTHKKDIASIIAYRIDRISRNTIDYLAIRKTLSDYGISVLSATEPTGSSPTEIMLETILASFGQLDNSIRGERARNGLRKRFLSGLPASSCPLGYKHETIDKKRQIVKDDSFTQVKDAWNFISTGTKTLTEMATTMNSWGLRVTWGKKERLLDKQYCSKMFRNTFYMGILPSKLYKEKIRGVYEPMITEELFYRVQAIIDGRNTTGTSIRRNVNNENFPLRGVVVCGVCGRPLSGGFSKGRHKRYPYYFCLSGCKGSVIATDKLNDRIVELLREITPSKETLEWFKLKLHAGYDKRLKVLENQHRQSEKKILDLKEQYNLLVQKNMSGLYSDEIFKETARQIESELAVAHLVKSENLIDKYNIEEIIKFTSAILADLGRAYELSSLEQKRVLLGSIYEEKLQIVNKTNRTAHLSPLFALIDQFNRGVVNSCAEELTQIEPLIAKLHSLYQAYPNYKQLFV